MNPLVLNLWQSIAWAIVDSLWQMGLLSLSYALWTRFSGTQHPAQRYRVALYHYFLGFILFATYFISHVKDVHIFSLRHLDSDPIIAGFSPTLLKKWCFLGAGVLYSLLTSYHLFRVVIGLCYIRALTKEYTKPLPLTFIQMIEQWRSHLQLDKKIQVRLSDKITGPFTAGFWKPFIYWPVSSFTRLTSEQVESLLIHELSHIRRNDFIVNLFLRLTHAFLYFNPFAQIFLSIIEKEREMAVDDQVLSVYQQPVTYAEALIALQKISHSSRIGLNAHAGDHPLLMLRIERITGRPCERNKTKRPQRGILWMSIAFISLYIFLSAYPDQPAARSLPQADINPLKLADQSDMIIKKVSQNTVVQKSLADASTIKSKGAKKNKRVPAILETDLDGEPEGVLYVERIGVPKISTYSFSHINRERAFTFENKEKGPDNTEIPTTEPFIPSYSFDNAPYQLDYLDSMAASDKTIEQAMARYFILQKILKLQEQLQNNLRDPENAQDRERLMQEIKQWQKRLNSKSRKIVLI